MKLGAYCCILLSLASISGLGCGKRSCLDGYVLHTLSPIFIPFQAQQCTAQTSCSGCISLSPLCKWCSAAVSTSLVIITIMINLSHAARLNRARDYMYILSCAHCSVNAYVIARLVYVCASCMQPMFFFFLLLLRHAHIHMQNYTGPRCFSGIPAVICSSVENPTGNVTGINYVSNHM